MMDLNSAMRLLLLLLITLGSAFGADSEAIMKKMGELVLRAGQAADSNRNSEAEEDYKAAIIQCDLLPPSQYHCKTNVLWTLGRFYEHANDTVNSEAVYKERLEILVAHQRPGSRPDLEIGDTLFELQSILSNSKDNARDADETAYMEQARRFYEQCNAGFPDLRTTCDRRLADVEGLHGSLLTLKRRLDEAAPFLKAVIDRPDSGVRKAIMVSALQAHATALILQGKAAEAQEFIQRAQRLQGPPPKRLSGAEPEYTEAARTAGITGTVILEIDISDSGSVSRVRVLKSLDSGLDENSVHAVQRWRFEARNPRNAMTVECRFDLLGKPN